MHISFDREACCRQQSLQGGDVVAVEPEPVSELEPTCDPAFAGRGTVVIEKPAAPFPPDIRIRAARNQARVLYRNHGLVVVAVERPGLDLTLGAPSAMKQVMERVQTVIAPCSDVTQLCFQLIRCEQCRHSSILIPSSATSKPAASTARRCDEPSIRI